MSQNKLFLIDGHAMLYRSYFAFIKNPRINSKGVNTSGIFGFVNTLFDLIQTQKPTHIGVVFDPKGNTFRHRMYEQYKANRQETPEDLRASIPHVMEIIQGMNIPVIQIEDYEADDVVGTLAKQAAAQGFEVYMATPDKDYCQLVQDNIYIYRPRSFGAGIEILGIPEVLQKFEVAHPHQVIDILGLWGDSSDNVPGAPGIGEKTAKALIAQYGSIEGIYEHIDELKGKQKESLINNKELVLLSKQLVTIKIDVPVDFNSYNFVKEEFNVGILQEKFKELEFRTMLDRLVPQRPTPVTTAKPAATQQSMQLGLFDEPAEQPVYVSSFQTIATVEHSYYLVDNQSHIHKLIQELLSKKEFCFDTETTSLNTLDAELCGIAFSFEAHKAYYVPFPTNQQAAYELAQLFAPVFTSTALKIGQNLKFDMAVLANYDIVVAGPLFDTMLAHYIIQPEGRHKLESLSEQYLNYEMVKIEELIGKKGKTQGSFRDVPLEQAKEYAGEDADITFQLYPLLHKELVEKGQLDLFTNIEVPLVSVLCYMERAGVNIDTAALNDFSTMLTNEVQTIEKQIYDLAGETFNIGSPKQLGEILFDKLQISEKAKKTKTKQYATGEEVLEKLLGVHPIIALILEFRELKKLLSTYVDSLPLLVNPKTGYIHASFNQAIVATGRLSSTNPNMQNIPIKTAKGREIRKAFIPLEPEHVFVSADYSQIELRVIAHMSSDEQFIQAFINGEDVHSATAAKIFNVSIDEVTPEQRRQAKSANFAIAYGSSAFGLSQTLNIPRKDAQFLIDGYFANYPNVKAFMDSQINSARELGYVETMFGRRRYVPDIHSQNATVRGFAERNAVNAPIQGTAADIMKIAMIRIHSEMKQQNMQSKLIMQVHDELNFSVHTSELETMKHIISQGMQQAVSLSVPLLVELGVGKNWLEAH